MQMELVKHGISGTYLPNATVWHYVPKERCSPEWVLNWANRVGKSHGRRAAIQGRKYGLAGVLYHSLKPKLSATDVVSVLSGSRFGRFTVRHRYRYLRGLIEGYRLGLNDKRLKEPGQAERQEHDSVANQP